MTGSKSPVQIIGIPMDLSQSHRGVDMGPSAIRYAGLTKMIAGLGYEVNNYGNIFVPVKEDLENADHKTLLEAIKKTCEDIYNTASDSIKDEYFPLFIGGDHSISIGTIGGITSRTKTGVIWVDAHGDFNLPETSPSGNIHGMPLSILIGKGYPELVDLGRTGAKINYRDVVMIGIRSLDNDEKIMLHESGIKIFSMRDIDEKGMSCVVQEALSYLGNHERIHLSFDMDSIDPDIAPGVGTPVKGGMTLREAHLLMEILSDSDKIKSVDMVEINPILDHHNRTAEMAVDLIASLLGKKII
jgi:arginase